MHPAAQFPRVAATLGNVKQSLSLIAGLKCDLARKICKGAHLKNREKERTTACCRIVPSATGCNAVLLCGTCMQGLAASLLTHDSPAIKLGDPAGRARLSTLGCAMLGTVLRLPKVCSQGYTPLLPDTAFYLLHGRSGP